MDCTCDASQRRQRPGELALRNVARTGAYGPPSLGCSCAIYDRQTIGCAVAGVKRRQSHFATGDSPTSERLAADRASDAGSADSDGARAYAVPACGV